MKISEIVERNKPTLGEKGQYGYVRKPEEKAKRGKRKSRDGEAGPSNEEMDFISAPPILAPMPVSQSVPASGMPAPNAFGPVLYDPRLGPPPNFLPPPPSLPPSHVPPPEVVAARQHAAEEEDDENEWRTREGQGPPPQWARRAEEEEEPPKKRQRFTYAVFRSCSLCSIDHSFSPDDPSLHPIDQAVLDIANEYLFTVEEVKEFYDKCGDAERTRNRFQRFREVLSQLPDYHMPEPPQPVQNGHSTQRSQPSQVNQAPQVSQVPPPNATPQPHQGPQPPPNQMPPPGQVPPASLPQVTQVLNMSQTTPVPIL